MGVHKIARTKYGPQKIKTLKLIGRVAKCEVEFFLSQCWRKTFTHGGHNVQRHLFLYILVQKLSKSEHCKLRNCLICVGYFFQNAGIVRQILVIQYNEFKNVHSGIKMSTVDKSFSPALYGDRKKIDLAFFNPPNQFKCLDFLFSIFNLHYSMRPPPPVFTFHISTECGKTS